ncbi:hypothetical protein FBBAL38_03755 [Flavobacteria bacterium BAL38]|nr:hypothetical protein FBBAL38_03755 [Flavobacteria bacterium BAL38]
MLQLEGIYLNLKTKIKQMKKLVYIISLSIMVILILTHKRNQIYNIIESEQMTIYLYFDSYTKQFGYPSNKIQFEDFIKYYENVNNDKSKVWDYEFEFTNKNDSIIVDLNSIYFFTKPNILKVKKNNNK